MKKTVNIIACGALANELVALKSLNDWQHFNIDCLPAKYHSTPNLIPEAVREKITQIRERDGSDSEILIAYGDCGTGGLLDRVIEESNAINIDENLVSNTASNIADNLDDSIDSNISSINKVSRLPGAHCYQFFAGHNEFNDLHEAEIGTFYLTDFLTQHFETYVWKMLGLDRKPELLEMYFGNYKKVVYLAQTENTDLTEKAKIGAQRLGLSFERIFTGYGEMQTELENNEFHISVESLSASL